MFFTVTLFATLYDFPFRGGCTQAISIDLMLTAISRLHLFDDVGGRGHDVTLELIVGFMQAQFPVMSIISLN